MYTAQITKERIKGLCKIQKISMEQMLSELNLGVNAVRQITDTKGMSSVSLYKIADYLNVSVDYLLGRTDNPDGTGNNISQSNIAGNKNASINNASPAPVHDSVTDEFMKIFKELSFEDKAELMHSAVQMKKKED